MEYAMIRKVSLFSTDNGTIKIIEMYQNFISCVLFNFVCNNHGRTGQAG